MVKSPLPSIRTCDGVPLAFSLVIVKTYPDVDVLGLAAKITSAYACVSVTSGHPVILIVPLP